MDVVNRSVHHFVLADALALFYDLYDHWKGDKKPKMDGHFFAVPAGIGMLICFLVATTARMLGLA